MIELVRSSAIRSGSRDGGDGGRAVFVVELDPIYMWCHSPHDSLSRFPQWQVFFIEPSFPFMIIRWQGSFSQSRENLDLEKEPRKPIYGWYHRPYKRGGLSKSLSYTLSPLFNQPMSCFRKCLHCPLGPSRQSY